MVKEFDSLNILTGTDIIKNNSKPCALLQALMTLFYNRQNNQ